MSGSPASHMRNAALRRQASAVAWQRSVASASSSAVARPLKSPGLGAAAWNCSARLAQCHASASRTACCTARTRLRDDRAEDDEPGPTSRAIAAWLEPATLTTAGEIETARLWYDFDRGRDAVAQTQAARAGRKVKITDALLREVADIYRANVSDKPTEAVAEHFDKAHRRAALYIKRARKRGFLGPAIRGKAGEQ
jgi:hypothetical protein